MSNTNSLLRPVGMLEKLYTARQVLGIYNSVIVTATYTVPSNPTKNEIYSTMSLTLPALLRRHPPLCCYVEGQTTPTPVFRRVDTFTVSDVLQILDLETQNVKGEAKEESLVKKLEDLHDQPWPLDAKPPWKLVVLRETPPPNRAGETSELQLHIAFIYHHVIGDGLSGLAFHKSLLRELSRGSPSNSRPASESLQIPKVITIPDSIKLIEPIEKLTAFPLSWSFLAKQILYEYAPRWLIGAPAPIWAGLPVQKLGNLPLRSRLRVVRIPACEVALLLKKCKENKVSLTSLLTASVVATMANMSPDPDPDPGGETEKRIEVNAPPLALRGITPYSLRRASGTSNDEIVNQISAFSTDYPAALLARIRAASSSTSPSPSIRKKERFTDLLWEISRIHHAQTQTELVQCPRDNVVGLLPYISDYLDLYKRKFGREREASFEVSNLGVFETGVEGEGGDGGNGKVDEGDPEQQWKLASLLFTQGAAPVGPAVNVNVVSVRGGALTVAVGWQEGVVGEGVGEALVAGLGGLAGLLRGG